jgi:hypothetical protein
MIAQKRVEKLRWFCPWLSMRDTGRASGSSRDRSSLDLKDMLSIAEMDKREVCIHAKTDQTQILRASNTC